MTKMTGEGKYGSSGGGWMFTVILNGTAGPGQNLGNPRRVRSNV